MSVNYTISDLFNYTYTGPLSTTNTGSAAAAEISTINTTGGFAGIVGGEYFVIYTTNDATGYYVWFDVTGTDTDPAPPGLTGIEVDWTVDSVTTDGTLAIAIGARLDAVDPLFGTPVVVGNLVTVTLTTTGPTTDINATTATLLPPTGITVAVTQQGRNAASSNTGLLYRDGSNNNEVRVLTASPNAGYVLTTTGANVIGWASPSGSNNTAFAADKTALQQTFASDSLLTTYTTVTWNELIDEAPAFASNTYTAPATGIYTFGVDLQWDASASKNNKGQRVVRIRNTATSSTLLEVREQVNADKTIAFWQRLITTRSVTATNTIVVQVTHDASVTQTVGVLSQFYGYMIEP